MKKTKIIMVIVMMVALSFLVAADDQMVCCEKTKYGACQNVLASSAETECIGAAKLTTSCDQTSFCRPGTCVDLNSGVCSPNTPERVCENEGGTWYDAPRDEVELCKRGCCQIGTSASFVTEADCTRLATKYKVDVRFRKDITDEASCTELASEETYGACVIQTLSRSCSMTTKNLCKSARGIFYKDLLCTAPGLSDCAPTSNTECFDGDVYFLDSCNNKANIWDPKKEKDVNNYWKKVQEPSCSGPACGDCDYASGTLCENKNGKARCKDLGCYENGKKIAEHGESWCAESEGTAKIEIDLMTQKLLGKTRETFERGFESLNLPGSRYYKLTCLDGQIIQESCMDFRNGVCKEGKLDNGFKHATCMVNTWRECFDIENKTACESDEKDCKWVGGEKYRWGYTFNGTVYPYDGEDLEELEIRNQKQGSCVPLYAPGFDFYSEDEVQVSGSNSVCAMGGVQVAAVFETDWEDSRTKEIRDGSTNGVARRCFDGGCYAIPDYGLSSRTNTVKGLTLVDRAHRGRDAGGDGTGLNKFYLSERRGYYCRDATGSVNEWYKFGYDGEDADCARSKSKRKDFPLFLNHGLWIDSIQERARSIGDCGYKKNIMDVYGQEDSETISSMFQKLTQSGKVDSNKKGLETNLIYRGNSRVTNEGNYHPSGIFKKGGETNAFYWRAYKWWSGLHPGEPVNLGEKTNFK